VLFTEPVFLFLFLPVLLALYFAPAVRVRLGPATSGAAAPAAYEHASYANWLLLVASVVFYATGGGSFTWLMMGSIAFNYWMAIAIDRARDAPARASRLLAAAVAVNLVVLGSFKYANFFDDNANTVFRATGLPVLAVPRVLLPIGISFFTFHAISYVVDVYH
jgi:alginate O-acetyltransferase complex protein AlgI